MRNRTIFGGGIAVIVFVACVSDEPGGASVGDAGGDSSTSDASDSGANDSGGSDAAPACDLNAPFVTPSTRVWFENDAAIVAQIRMTSDELNGFMNFGPDGGHLGVTSRGNSTGVFGSITEITSIESPGSFEIVGSVTGDGQTLYYGRDDVDVDYHLWMASASGGVGNFAGAQNLATLNGAAFDAEPYISNDGSELWFTSGRSGSEDIYVAENTGAGFSAPRAVDELNSDLIEQTPAITGDKLTIFFTRYNALPDGGLVGDADVWTAHRDSTTSTFSTPVRVTEIDTPGGEYVSWVSPDGCRLYYSSNYTLYVVSRPLK